MRGARDAQASDRFNHPGHLPQARLDQCASATRVEGSVQLKTTCHGPRMRATQMTSALHFQGNREPNWVAHTPVGHDSFGYGENFGYFPNIHLSIPGNNHPPCTSEWAPSPHS